MTPKSFRQKSPKALDMASPGELTFGNHTLEIPGSFLRPNTLPLQILILSASPDREMNKNNKI